MIQIVNVISFYTGSDDVGDLVIKTSSNNDNITQLIESNQSWSFEIRASDGRYRAMKKFDSINLSTFKHSSNNKTQYEWERLVYDLLFNELPPNMRASTILSASLSEKNNLVLDISLLIGNSIKKSLGKIELDTIDLESVDDEDETYDDLFDLFEWTKILKVERDSLKERSALIEEDKSKLESKLTEILEHKEDLVSQLQKKDIHKMKVFTKILNDLQEYNRKVLSGESFKEEDHFNIDYIRHAVHEIQQAEVKPLLKKRKTEKIKKDVKAEATPSRKLKASSKRKQAIKKESDSDFDFIKDKAYDEIEPIKAKSLPSEVFKFSKDQDTNDNKPNNLSELYDLNEEREGEEFAEGDDSEDEEEEVDEMAVDNGEETDNGSDSEDLYLEDS